MRILSVMFVLMFGSLFAADVDFSGNWVLNKEKSELGQGRGGRMAAARMVVVHKDNALTVESTRTGRDGEERTMKEELTLDGTKSKRSTDWAEIVSSASLDGEVLKIFQTRTFDRNGETMEMESQQEWTLDGNRLVITMKVQSPRGDREMKMVYDKK